MLKTKIDWCDYTWNPVWGCLMGCPYCYARKISKRFVKKIIEKEMNFLNNYCEFCGFDYFSKLQKFEPTFIWSNFQKEFPKKNSMIFVNSMSDISFWEDEWMNKVLWKIKEYSQHIFMFLTKDTSIYADYDFPENCWLGYTFITQKQIDEFMLGDNGYFPEKNKFFISLEPIQEPLKINFEVDWLIIGRETGNRKDKIIPKREWIEDIVIDFQKFERSIFLKNNLQSIWREQLIQEFPR